MSPIYIHPKLVDDFISQFRPDKLYSSVILFRNQNYIRNYLKQNGYVSFIKNGAVLPRRGKTDYKDSRSVIPFKSPESMEITILLPDGESVTGMGVKTGITIITGDAYHGKSTILDAIKEGVYNHVTGDGREYVITDETALSIQAEDGRSIRNTDISFFLRNLPVKWINPQSFSTDNASGSTSQAAAVSEAIESGCKLMLFDEDRSANNFMYKDRKMRSVIKNSSTYPFIDNARMLYNKYGISSVIIVGASGEYFKIADHILLIDKFVAYELMDYKKTETRSCGEYRPCQRYVDFSKLREICLSRNMEIRDDTTIKLGNEILNIPDILPNATRGQLDFICSFLYYMTVIEPKRQMTMYDAINSLYRKIDLNGVITIHQNDMRGASHIEYVRKYDMMCILYRMKSIIFKDGI